jgi:hypothetical protein
MSKAHLEYKAILKAIIDNGIIDYVKLQHPNNRKKRYLQEAFVTSVAMFFDKSYVLGIASKVDGTILNLESALQIVMDGQLPSVKKAQEHVISESIEYWYEKHFQNLLIPKNITIAGKVYFVFYEETETPYINKEKHLLVLNKKSKTVDREFTNLCLNLILEELEIDLSNYDLENFNKLFYLFLKVNGCFAQKVTEETE